MLAYIRRVGLELDVFLNVGLLDGDTGVTVSHHAAVAAESGRVWGCVLCKWLSWTVETNHCAKTLAGTTTKPAAAIRAGVQLFAVAGVFLMVYAYVEGMF